MIAEISVNEILGRIQETAKKNNVNLTYTNMKVYLSLLDYAEELKDKAQLEPLGIRFDVTTQELAKYCSVAPLSITETLRKLKKCGIIKYTTAVPQPSVVMLYKRYYA